MIFSFGVNPDFNYSSLIHDQYVEENELIQLSLGDYFRGNLLNYNLKMTYTFNDSDGLNDMIKL